MSKWERKLSAAGDYYWEREWMVGVRRHYSATVQKSIVTGLTERYEFRIYYRNAWLDGGPAKTYTDRYNAQRGAERYITTRLKQQGLIKGEERWN